MDEKDYRIKELEAKLEFAEAGTEQLEGLIHTLRTRNERLKQAVELHKKWTDNMDKQFEVGENEAYSNVLMWLEDSQSCEAAIKNAEDALKDTDA